MTAKRDAFRKIFEPTLNVPTSDIVIPMAEDRSVFLTWGEMDKIFTDFAKSCYAGQLDVEVETIRMGDSFSLLVGPITQEGYAAICSAALILEFGSFTTPKLVRDTSHYWIDQTRVLQVFNAAITCSVDYRLRDFVAGSYEVNDCGVVFCGKLILEG